MMIQSSVKRIATHLDKIYGNLIELRKARLKFLKSLRREISRYLESSSKR